MIFLSTSAVFWCNGMGFHIWRMFNVGGSKKPFREDLKKFLMYMLCAQGVPLLISINTILVDTQRGPSPNMGHIPSFLGSGKQKNKYSSENRDSYFASPKFIFNDQFLYLAMLTNSFFCISILKVLHRGFEDQTDRQRLMG